MEAVSRMKALRSAIEAGLPEIQERLDVVPAIP
jgi:hypothetical protein